MQQAELSQKLQVVLKCLAKTYTRINDQAIAWNSGTQATRQLDVKAWSAGIYFVRLAYAGRMVVKKLVVE